MIPRLVTPTKAVGGLSRCSSGSDVQRAGVFVSWTGFADVLYRPVRKFSQRVYCRKLYDERLLSNRFFFACVERLGWCSYDHTQFLSRPRHSVSLG